MRKKLIYLPVINLIFISFCYGQWGTDYRLTVNANETHLCLCSGRGLAVSGDMVHAVYCDNRPDSGYKIFYRRSTNLGIDWLPETLLVENPYTGEDPASAVNGPIVHVAWDNRNSNYNPQIFYKRSSDNGATWSIDTNLSNPSNYSCDPAIAVSGTNVYLAWHDKRHGIPGELYFQRSTDGGVTWLSEIRLTNDPAWTYVPALAISEPYVHIAWCDERLGGRKLFYKRSTDFGQSWSMDTCLVTDTLIARDPAISVRGPYVHILCCSRVGVIYKRSTDNGLTWENSVNCGPGYTASIAASGNNVHAIKCPNNYINYSFSMNNGQNWQPFGVITYNSVNPNRPSIALFATSIHLIWEDNRDSNIEIYYKRDPTGNIDVKECYPDGLKNDLLIYPINKNGIVFIGQVIADHRIDISIYDVYGARIYSGCIYPKSQRYALQDPAIRILPTGVYFLHYEVENIAGTKKIILLK